MVHQEKTLTTKLDIDKNTVPTYTENEISEIAEEPGMWLTGVKYYGSDIPDITWKDVPIPPNGEKQLLDNPADIISSIVLLAVKLKKKKEPIPKWSKKTIQELDQNTAMRNLVVKKLKQYKQTALSYDELCQQIGE